jgi:hypothetical protein
MTKEELIQKQIEDIMDEFNFAEVQKVMESLNWTWSETGCVPEEYDLRKGARKLLKEAAKMIDDKLNLSGGSTSTGGFLATSRAGYDHYDKSYNKWLRLDLHFCVDSVTLDGESFD